MLDIGIKYMKSNYKLIKIRRLYNRYASIRSYERIQALHERKGIRIELKGTNEVMTIECKDLHKGVDNGIPFKSKRVEGQKYTLIDFDWKPDRKAQQLSILGDNKPKKTSSPYVENVHVMQHLRLEDLRKILYGTNR